MNDKTKHLWLKIVLWLPICIIVVIVFAIYRMIEKIVEVIKHELNTCKSTVSS